jgi:hypothetical protein
MKMKTLMQTEPRLRELYADVRRISRVYDPDKPFCANDVWFGYRDRGAGLRGG